jgi:hypothetical protein
MLVLRFACWIDACLRPLDQNFNYLPEQIVLNTPDHVSLAQRAVILIAVGEVTAVTRAAEFVLGNEREGAEHVEHLNEPPRSRAAMGISCPRGVPRPIERRQNIL